MPLLPADLPRAENIGLHVPVLRAQRWRRSRLIALFVGVWPALEASRGGLAASVADLSRGNTGRRGARGCATCSSSRRLPRRCGWSIGATLLMRSFAELRQVNPGFNAERVYSLHLAIPRAKYPKDRDVAAFCARDRSIASRRCRTSSPPGMVNRLPLAAARRPAPIEFEGIDPRGATRARNVDYRTGHARLFPRRCRFRCLAAARSPTRDAEDAPPVAIIDERLAKTVFADVDPLGRRVRDSGSPTCRG